MMMSRKCYALLLISILVSTSFALDSITPAITANNLLLNPYVTQYWSNKELNLIDSLRLKSLPRAKSSPSNLYADNPKAALLGKKIFNDKRFSANGKVSCATCHQQDYNFTDKLALAEGVGTTARRSMPAVGMAYQRWFFWDGRADSLWSQALGPLENPVEHGISRTRVAQLVQRYYKQDYQALFKRNITADFINLDANATPNSSEAKITTAWMAITVSKQQNINQIFVDTGKSLAAFLRTIKPTESRFDRYADALLDNDKQQKLTHNFLSNSELNGLKLFIGKGSCINCHNGPLFSNGEFHHAGTPSNGAIDRGRAEVVATLANNEFGCLSKWSDADKSKDCQHIRYLNSRVDIMEQAFKTPSLRNVAVRPPYMHAGQFQTLAAVLGNYQQFANSSPLTDELFHGELSDGELVDIEAFLGTLTGGRYGG